MRRSVRRCRTCGHEFELLFSIGAVIVVAVLLSLEARRARRGADD